MAYGFNDEKEKVNVYSQDEMTAIMQQMLLSVYPVGSIYMSVNSADPSTLFGGTWTRWGAGRVPVSVNESGTEFKTVEKTGGTISVALTQAQIPAHIHTVPAHGHTAAAANAGSHSHHVQRTQGAQTTSGGTAYLAQGSIDNSSNTSTAGDHTHEITVYPRDAFGTTATGGSAAHSNLQPYITCYMWKRTA
jgi:microcystin-dependent protein